MEQKSFVCMYGGRGGGGVKWVGGWMVGMRRLDY